MSTTTLKRTWCALAATLFIIAGMLPVPSALGWGERIDNPHFLTIIACRSQPHTKWGPNERPIPGVDYRELWTNEDGEYECMRDIADIVPKNPDQAPGDLSVDTQCVKAAMGFGPEWERTHPGWVVVKVGCPKPVMSENGDILGYHAPPCPRDMKCKFNEQEI